MHIDTVASVAIHDKSDDNHTVIMLFTLKSAFTHAAIRDSSNSFKGSEMRLSRANLGENGTNAQTYLSR